MGAETRIVRRAAASSVPPMQGKPLVRDTPRRCGGACHKMINKLEEALVLSCPSGVGDRAHDHNPQRMGMP